MIKLKELLHLPTLYLYDDICEANSGYSDHKLYDEISEKIYSGWIKLLNSIEDKNLPLCQIPENKLDLAINKGIKFDILLAFDDARSTLTFDVLLAIKDVDHQVEIEKGAITDNVRPIEVYLVLNSKCSVDDILKKDYQIQSIAHHESVHIIKTLQKKHQLSFNRNELDKKNENWWYKYYSNSDEVHAYIAQINNELKQLKLKDKNISLSNALKSSKIWKRYVRDIFNKSPKLKNKMLSKIVNYWNKL